MNHGPFLVGHSEGWDHVLPEVLPQVMKMRREGEVHGDLQALQQSEQRDHTWRASIEIPACLQHSEQLPGDLGWFCQMFQDGTRQDDVESSPVGDLSQVE